MRFVAVIGVFLAFMLMVVGADYYEQSRGPDGVASVTEYVEGFHDRTAWIRGEKSARPEPALKFLPDAPAGWTRRAWQPTDDGKLDRTADMADYTDEILNDPTAKSLKGLDTAAYHERKMRTTLVYELGAHHIELSARKTRGARGGDQRQNSAMQVVAANIAALTDETGFAVIQGVVWTKSLGMFGSITGDDGILSVSARMGDIRLGARTDADPELLRALLARIDYDGLNGLLEQPLVGVGSTAPELTPAQEAVVSELSVRSAERGENARIRHSETRMLDAMRQGSSLPLPDSIPGLVQGKGTGPEALQGKEFAKAAQRRKSVEESGALAPEMIARPYSNGNAASYAQTLQALGLAHTPVRIAYDGFSATAAQEWAAFRAGTMSRDHPGLAVRGMEVGKGLAPGSCVQLDSGGIYCEQKAEALRWQAETQARNDAVLARQEQPSAAPETRSEIKINRLSSGGGKRLTSGCGGTAFCKVGGN